MNTYTLPAAWENALLRKHLQGLSHRERLALKEWQQEHDNPVIKSSSRPRPAPFNGSTCECMDYCTI